MKVFSIVKTFDKKQLSGFLTYILLYHKPESKICKVAEWLNFQKRATQKIEIEPTADDLFQVQPYSMSRQTFLNLMATLGNIAEEYVGWMDWKESNNLKYSCQLSGLARKSLSVEYMKTQKLLESDRNQEVVSIWNDFYKMKAVFNDYYYQISPSEDNHTSEFNEMIQLFRKSTASIAQFLMVEIKNRERLLSETWEHHHDFFQNLYKNKTELVHITDKLLLLNSQKDIQAYEELIDLLYSERIHGYSHYVQYCISTYCIVFLTGLIKQGAIDRGQELLDLYEFSLVNGIFTLNETMTLSKFLNIIGVASKFKKYNWARKIVDNWAHTVDRNNAKTMTEFGHATIDFHQQKFEDVVMVLSQMKTSNFMHRLRARWLLLKAQYEINRSYVGVLKVQIDNFRRFLISNESRLKKSTFIGIKSSLKMMNMVLDRKDPELMITFYIKCNFVFERKWVLKQIKNPMR